jgi:hypothetical protein
VRSVVTFFMKGRQDQRNCSEAGLLKQTLLQTPGEQQTGFNFEQSSLREIALHTVPGTYREGFCHKCSGSTRFIIIGLPGHGSY